MGELGPASARSATSSGLRAIERGRDVLLEVSKGAGARDRQGHRREGQEPRQRDLRDRGAVPGRDLGQALVAEVGLPPPSGKNGAKAMPSAAQASRTAASSRLAMWKLFCTAATGAIARASARWASVDVAETEVADQALLAQRGEGLEAFGEGLAVRRPPSCRCAGRRGRGGPRLASRGSPRPARAARAGPAPERTAWDRRPDRPWWR